MHTYIYGVALFSLKDGFIRNVGASNFNDDTKMDDSNKKNCDFRLIIL